MPEYNRKKAVAYAHKWALRYNPAYYNFSGIGGDCSNFASQCILAGAGVANYKPLYGWYYNNLEDRAPAWSSVKYLHRFLTTNQGAGPYAKETDIREMQLGDIIQLATWMEDYHHTIVVVETGVIPSVDNILVSCHSYDSDNRPLST
jgi:hypothetical protein